MGLDTENIKKRLSQLELDVKQMNQMIDENLDINETTLDSANEDEHILNGELDDNNVDDTSLHEKGDTYSLQLEDNGNKGRDIIDSEGKNINIENKNETDKDNIKESTSNQSYLQEEILEAIDNTQKSFVENAPHESTNEGEINNLTSKDTAFTGDQDTIKEMLSKEKSDQKQETISEIEHVSIEQEQIQEFNNISNANSTIFFDNNDDRIQVNMQGESPIQHKSSITDLLINDQETAQENNDDNTNDKKNKIHNSVDVQEDTLNSNPKHGKEKDNEAEIDENMHNASKDDDSTIPSEQIEQHPVDINKQGSLAEVEREQDIGKQEITDSQPINIHQTEDTIATSEPQENEQVTDDNNDSEKTKPRAMISEDKNEDEWEDIKEENVCENNETVNEMESMSTGDNTGIRQPSAVRYDLSLNDDKIILPKHTNGKDITIATCDNNTSSISESTMFKNENIEDKSSPSTVTVEKRKTTNPFRVISVSSPTSTSSSRVNSTCSNHSSHSSRKSSSFQKDTNYNANADDSIMKLQNRHEYLMEKCIKLEKEIKYLRQMESQGSLTLEDGKKLNRAINKLQEYLDRKTKERYEIGVLLSRNLRRQINRGENGEFWIGRK